MLIPGQQTTQILAISFKPFAAWRAQLETLWVWAVVLWQGSSAGRAGMRIPALPPVPDSTPCSVPVLQELQL